MQRSDLNDPLPFSSPYHEQKEQAGEGSSGADSSAPYKCPALESLVYDASTEKLTIGEWLESLSIHMRQKVERS